MKKCATSGTLFYRPTFVHRFLVRGTIEQRMHYLLETVQAPVNSHNSEETNMTIGDLTALFQEIQVSGTVYSKRTIKLKKLKSVVVVCK